MPLNDPSATSGNHRFVVLDAWRGIAACLVALYHFISTSHLQNLPLLENSWLFVDFFFVLSGFVIFAGYEEKLKHGFGTGRFLFLRLGRLYPLHFALLLAFFATELLKFLPALGKFSAYRPFTAPGETAPFIISNLLLVHSMGIHDRLSWNDPSWSVGVEFYTYVLFGLAIPFLKDKIRWLLLALILLAPLFIALRSPGYMNTTYQYGFVRCLFGFSAGALCWHLFQQQSARVAALSSSRFWDVLEIGLLVLLAVFVSEVGSSALTLASPLIFSVTVLTFAMERGVISRLLKGRVFALLGLLSYSIYMDHMFLRRKLFVSGGLLAERFFHVSIIRMVDGTEQMGTSVWQGDIFTAIYVVLLVAVSYLTYYAIEHPAREWFKAFVRARDRRAIAVGTEAVPLAFGVSTPRQEDLA